MGSLKPGKTIFDHLQEGGYRTGLFTSNSFLISESLTGLSHDFETVVGDLKPAFPGGINLLNYDGEYTHFSGTASITSVRSDPY